MRILIFAFFTLVYTQVPENFLQANKWFSGSLYKKFAKNAHGNFLLSPFSAQSALALTYLGSRGQTAEEIRRVLNFTNDPTQLKTTFQNLLPELKSSQKYTLRTANKIYVKEDFSLKPGFVDVALEVFGANAENVNFERRREAAQKMNVWVEQQTNYKIHNLIEASNLNDRTRTVLINALYLKANWSRPFLVAYTKKLDFYLKPQEKVVVDMMLLHDKPFNYFESNTLKARFLELPFKGEDASMVVVLPNEIDGLPSLENQIKKVLKVQNFSRHLINLGFPKFKIETSLDLKKILKNMGVTQIFDVQNADLSEIAGERGDLLVDRVSQKSIIDVSEEGVEAAAATYTLIAIPMSGPSEVPKNFRIDRPFLFYIKVKGVVVFIGRVLDPRNY